MGEIGNIYIISDGKPYGRGPLGKHIHRPIFKDSVNLFKKNMVCRSGLDSFDSGQGSVAGSWEHGKISPGR
jgi:hypothetical protein